MTTLSEIAENVKMWKARRPSEPESLQAAADKTARWGAYCMHVDCNWAVAGLFSESAAMTGAELHNDTTGHPVKLRVAIEFECGVIRSQIGGR